MSPKMTVSGADPNRGALLRVMDPYTVEALREVHSLAAPDGPDLARGVVVAEAEPGHSVPMIVVSTSM